MNARHKFQAVQGAGGQSGKQAVLLRDEDPFVRKCGAMDKMVYMGFGVRQS